MRQARLLSIGVNTYAHLRTLSYCANDAQNIWSAAQARIPGLASTLLISGSDPSIEPCKTIVDGALLALSTAGLLDGCTIFVFYAVLYRSALIPRVLAGLGLIAAVLQVSGVSMPLFGGDVVFPLLAPLGLIQLAVSVWLIVRGFRPVLAVAG